jgi:hypothetical protein
MGRGLATVRRIKKACLLSKSGKLLPFASRVVVVQFGSRIVYQRNLPGQNAKAKKGFVPRFLRPKGFMNTGNVFHLPGNLQLVPMLCRLLGYRVRNNRREGPPGVRGATVWKAKKRA